jgi:hypothetical protein
VSRYTRACETVQRVEGGFLCVDDTGNATRVRWGREMGSVVSQGGVRSGSECGNGCARRSLMVSMSMLSSRLSSLFFVVVVDQAR